MDLGEEGACDVCKKEEVGEKERERNKGGKGRENEEGERDGERG